jgi:tetratricopeptide (TPR) repeat protein
LAAKGDYARALAELERGRPDDERRTGYLSFRGYIEAAAGDPRALQTLAELRARAQSAYVSPYYFALIYTALGDRDEALAELQRAHAEQDTTMTSVNVDPRFASLRTESRFLAIVGAMRFPAFRR